VKAPRGTAKARRTGARAAGPAPAREPSTGVRSAGAASAGAASAGAVSAGVRRPGAAERRARLAIFWIFALCGVICSLWSTSLPTINARLHLGETRLGVVLLLTAAGAVAVMPLIGRLCDRVGSRAVLRVGAPLSGLTLIGPALAGGFPALLAVAFVLGAGIGSLDVAMNAHAIVVEQRYGRPIMSAFHGFWSVGGVVGSAVIAAGLHFRAGDSGLIIGGAIASAVLLVLPGPLLLRGGGRATPQEPGRPAPGEPGGSGRAEPGGDRGAVAGGSGRAVPGGDPAVPGRPPAPRRAGSGHGVVLLLGLVAAAGFICEGAAYNWAPLHAIRELHAAPATAALAYTVFATALMTGRLTGDWLRRWLGPVRAMACAGGTAFGGYLLVALAPSLSVGGLACDYAGWAVTGLGLATVVPAIFSAVGARDGGVGRALSWVAVCAYAGELTGPAVIGPLAGATSLRIAMLVPAGLAVLIAVLGPVALVGARRGTGYC
jgi:MFS family permease